MYIVRLVISECSVRAILLPVSSWGYSRTQMLTQMALYLLHPSQLKVNQVNNDCLENDYKFI